STDSPPTPESKTPMGAFSAMLWPTDRAGWVTLDLQLAEATTQGIYQQQTAYQRLAKASQKLQCFKRLQAADHTHHRTEHTRLAASQLCFAAMAVQTVIARAALDTRIKNRQLPFQTNRGTTDQRLLRRHAGGIHDLTDGEVVGTV